MYVTSDRKHGIEARAATTDADADANTNAATVVVSPAHAGFLFLQRAEDGAETTVARLTPEGDLHVAGEVHGAVHVTDDRWPFPWVEGVVADESAVTLADGAVRRVKVPGATISADAFRGDVAFEDVTGVPLASASRAGVVRLNQDTDADVSTEAATASAVKRAYELADDCVRRAGDTVRGPLVLDGGDLVVVGGKVGAGLDPGVSPRHAVDARGDVNFTGRLLRNGTEMIVPETLWECSGDRVFQSAATLGKRVGLGTDDPRKALHVVGDVEVSGTLYRGGVPFPDPWKVNAARDVVYEGSGNVGVGVGAPSSRLHVEGDIYASGRISQLSDATHKRELRAMEGALERVCSLTGYTYADERGAARAGLVAQEVRGVLPESVVEDARTGTLSVEYGGLVALLLEAVKDLRSEVRELRDRDRDRANGRMRCTCCTASRRAE